MRRYLVIANQTLGSGLTAAQDRGADGEASDR